MVGCGCVPVGGSNPCILCSISRSVFTRGFAYDEPPVAAQLLSRDTLCPRLGCSLGLMRPTLPLSVCDTPTHVATTQFTCIRFPEVSSTLSRGQRRSQSIGTASSRCFDPPLRHPPLLLMTLRVYLSGIQPLEVVTTLTSNGDPSVPVKLS